MYSQTPPCSFQGNAKNRCRNRSRKRKSRRCRNRSRDEEHAQDQVQQREAAGSGERVKEPVLKQETKVCSKTNRKHFPA